MHAPRAAVGPVLALLVAGAACAADGTPPLPWEATPFPALPVPADNPITDAKIELGRLLFHDPILSSDRQVACVTCHGQIWGLSDGLALSIGVGGVGPAGTGRTGPTHTRRNSQTIWNAGYRATLFWDGRAASLEAQVLGPLDDATELGRPIDDVVTDLRAIPEYVTLFAAAFPAEAEPVTAINLQRAIATFERTLVSDDAPYDQYVRGDERALTAEGVRGMFLLEEVGCTSCHAPPLFESERFESADVPPAPDVLDDEGRLEVTGDPADAGKYRVPTLRNIRETGPYMHTGAIATLAEAIASHGANRPLAADELAAIHTFLYKGLMDRSREPVRPLTVPSGLPVPLDGYEIPR